MKTESGVMLIKDGKAWACTYSDGHSTSYGWVAIEDGQLFDPAWTKRPEDTVARGSHYLSELEGAEIVAVNRITEVKILPK